MTRTTQAFFALLLLASGSCASYRGEQLPQLSAKELTLENRMPAISYECKVGPASSNAANNMGWPGASNERLFRSAFVDARNAPAANDLHVDLIFQSEMRAPIFSLTLGMFTIASLGILPTYAREDLTLVARVENQGKFLREYEYHDCVKTWVEIFLLPWAFSHDPVEIQRATFENMELHLLRDLRKDLPQLLPVAQP